MIPLPVRLSNLQADLLTLASAVVNTEIPRGIINMRVRTIATRVAAAQRESMEILGKQADAIAQRDAAFRANREIMARGDESFNEPSVDDEIDTSVRGAYLALVGDA
jgi:hypothetical protein